MQGMFVRIRGPEQLPRLGICEKCGYKILIVLFIVLIVISYIAWFGVF